MKELTFFMLPSCPHCRLAQSFLDALKKENPAYAEIPIRRVDESREVALANSYDYFYVPSFFIDKKKLFEGHMEKEDVRAVLDAALAKD